MKDVLKRIKLLKNKGVKSLDISFGVVFPESAEVKKRPHSRRRRKKDKTIGHRISATVDQLKWLKE